MTCPTVCRRDVLSGLVGLLVGLACSWIVPLLAQAPPAQPVGAGASAPAAFAAEVPLHRGLDASLYMQTAAEYRACCLQAYNLASRRLRELHGAAEGGKPEAVVLDLDETVLDNAGFEAMLLRSGLTWDKRLWDMWQENGGDQVGLIPGARDFILEAGRLKVDVFYISNRDEKYREPLTKTLDRLGIAARDAKHLKLSTTTSDKSARRNEVTADYRVLLLLGDNLRDFDERFRSPINNARPGSGSTDPAKLSAAIQKRQDQVDETRSKWGEVWIILPNPVYGEWTAPLGLGKKDLDRLVPTVPKKP